MANTISNRSDQEVHDFLKSLLDVGEKYVDELKNDLKENKKEFKVSDVYDSENHQYVNLVQQGGGMLGIALLGCTYVLERMGIRFLKLAGTSAGAINATLMAALRPEKTQTLKSPIIMYYLAKKELFDFVDGHPIAKLLIKFTIKYNQYFILLLESILVIFLLYPVLIILEDFSYISLETTKWVAIFLAIILVISVFLYYKFHKSHFGINPGKAFHEWITDLMENGDVHASNDENSPLFIMLNSGKVISIYNPKNKISSLHDLENKLKKNPQLIYNYQKSECFVDGKTPLYDLQSYSEDEPSLAIIATELSTENKIIFPKMWQLFYKDHDNVKPADFVRASMSVPFFFEAFRLKNISERSTRSDEWRKYLRYNGDNIDEAVFVDGGSLSNFPINVFNPTKSTIPRIPTFGVRLLSETSADTRPVDTLGGLIRSILNTMKSYFDRDFLITHPQYESCLTNIEVQEFNWLDFNLPIDQQIKLFEKGASAAKEFLLKFDWEQYKQSQVALNEGVLAAKVQLVKEPQELQKLIKNEEEKRGFNNK